MSFISPEYVLFFSVIVPLFFVVQHQWRWLLLLITSYFFYAYGNVQYVPLIAFSTVVDYIAARAIANSKTKPQKNLWLALSICANLGVLFTFKYLDFINGSVSGVLNLLNVGYNPQPLNWILPIGISFYTFQSMSYTIDVYRGKLEPENHFGLMATYVSFFPQLVAGPIERATNLLPQFRESHRFDVDRTVSGLQQILWGFFKKVVIADRVAIYVNAVYNNVHDYTGQHLILATFFFAIQIYCDFSGYSDIAIGTARIMGFDLMENFRQPYFAQSVREFWGRWHISLSTWFRDYLYIPLGGNRVSLGRTVINLLIVFVVSGLWHGAGWTFIMWGFLHGLAIALQAVARHFGIQRIGGENTSWQLFRIIGTFAFVCFTWIFFRANNFADAQYVVLNLLNFNQVDLFVPFAEGLLATHIEFYLSLFLIGALLIGDAIIAGWQIEGGFRRIPLILRWGLYYSMAAAVILSGLYGSGAGQFIYFQF